MNEYYVIAKTLKELNLCHISISPTEDDAWEHFLNHSAHHIKSLRNYASDKRHIREYEENGYRAIKVKLIEVD